MTDSALTEHESFSTLNGDPVKTKRQHDEKNRRTDQYILVEDRGTFECEVEDDDLILFRIHQTFESCRNFSHITGIAGCVPFRRFLLEPLHSLRHKTCGFTNEHCYNYCYYHYYYHNYNYYYFLCSSKRPIFRRSLQIRAVVLVLGLGLGTHVRLVT